MLCDDRVVEGHGLTISKSQGKALRVDLAHRPVANQLYVPLLRGRTAKG
jgi:hypothetical protein